MNGIYMTHGETIILLEYFIEPGQQGQYIFLPFIIDMEMESLTLSYRYDRHDQIEVELEHGMFTGNPEINIVDLGLIDPDGREVGNSGSDKSEIFVSEVSATPGYHPCRLEQGEWKILIGAYKIAPEGVHVSYEVKLRHKELRLLKGDLHMHTHGSDGVVTAEELAWRAKRHGLDFIAITDHNQMTTRDSLPRVPGVTVIPGGEWTHFQGHANFLGAEQPYDGTFAGNSEAEFRARFDSARERGAFIVINHPFDEVCGFHFDWQSLPFDCLEVWNGPMRESNLRAIGLWQQLLAAGRKIPICGGSDYHRDTPFLFLGGPTTCVFALSNGPSDILEALREGWAYITFAPNGPWLELTAGEAIMGETVNWPEVKRLKIRAGGLLKGDVLRLVTGTGSEVLLQAPEPGEVELTYAMPAPGFARVEILRAFLPALPMLPALISNPIYFDEQ
jgi:hypothetical protein